MHSESNAQAYLRRVAVAEIYNRRLPRHLPTAQLTRYCEVNRQHLPTTKGNPAAIARYREHEETGQEARNHDHIRNAVATGPT